MKGYAFTTRCLIHTTILRTCTTTIIAATTTTLIATPTKTTTTNPTTKTNPTEQMMTKRTTIKTTDFPTVTISGIFNCEDNSNEIAF